MSEQRLLKRIAQLEAAVKAAFEEGYYARVTYNDLEESTLAEQWIKSDASHTLPPTGEQP